MKKIKNKIQQVYTFFDKLCSKYWMLSLLIMFGISIMIAMVWFDFLNTWNPLTLIIIWYEKAYWFFVIISATQVFILVSIAMTTIWYGIGKIVCPEEMKKPLAK